MGNFVFIPFTCQKGVQGGVGTIITLGNGLSFFFTGCSKGYGVGRAIIFTFILVRDMFGDVRITLENLEEKKNITVMLRTLYFCINCLHLYQKPIGEGVKIRIIPGNGLAFTLFTLLGTGEVVVVLVSGCLANLSA